MQWTRRDILRSAGPTAAAWALGFPAAGTAAAPADAASSSLSTASAVASNGYLSSLLPAADRLALRRINLGLTRLAIEQCRGAGGVANQIVFDTLICEALGEFAAHGVTPERLLALSGQFDVAFLWSLSYGDVRQTFNARFVRFPLAVAFPRTVSEVVFWVNFVRDHQFSVSIRSGNNCYESFDIDNEIVIDLTFLALRGTDEQFRVDRAAGVAHVAPGVRLGVLYTELAREGLTFAGGQCSPVSIGGLVATGGVGFSTRAFGYACDQLREVEYVLADGSVVVANAGNEHADLWRATKGAGAAGLGIITRLSVAVVPAVPVLFYTAEFKLRDAAAALAAWQDLAAAPDALSSVANITAGDPSSVAGGFFVNGEFRVDAGDVAAARRELEMVLRKGWLDRLPSPLDRTPIEIEAMTAVEAATTVALEAPMPVFNQWKLKSNFVFRRLSAAALRPLVDFLSTNAPADNPSQAVGALTILLAGGRANRINPASAVVPARTGTTSWFHWGALWNEQALEGSSLEFVAALSKVLKPILRSATGQYGVPDLQLGSQLTTPPDFGYLEAYWRGPTLDFVPFLLRVKKRYDPQDLFRFAQSIPVAPV